MWALVIIVIAINNNNTSSPAITNIPGFKSEESCKLAGSKTSPGNLDPTVLFGLNTGRHGMIVYDCIKVY